MAPKYRRKRGGNPYRLSQVNRRESGLPDQAEDPDNRDEYGNLRSRRPPEPEGPPPKSEPVREVITSSVVHLRSAGEVTTGSPGTLLVWPAPPATASTRAASSSAPPPLPPQASGSGWSPGIALDATRTGWVPGWVYNVYIAPESGASEPSVIKCGTCHAA